LRKDTAYDTGLVKISVHELDEHYIKAAPEEINILREKTFTKELSQLVNRIFTNESGTVENADEVNPLSIVEKNTLLNDLERFIYSLKHCEDLKKTGLKYNPFTLNIDVYDDIDDMDYYLNKGINQCGFSEFGVFKFIPAERSFRFDRGTLSNYLKRNCFFGLKDNIVKRDFSEYGIILTGDTIAQDPFLEKKFYNNYQEISKEDSFYINRVSSFCSNIFLEKKNLSLSIIEKYTSPLIVIKLHEESICTEEEIYSTIKPYMSIPLAVYMGKNALMPAVNDSGFEDCYNIIELFRNISDLSGLTWCILTGKELTSMESFFMLKYFFSKIKSSAGINSLVMRVASNRIIMALPPSNVETIKSITDKFNSRSSNYIDLRYVDDYREGGKNKLIEFFL
jgi:hypothetical protein